MKRSHWQLVAILFVFAAGVMAGASGTIGVAVVAYALTGKSYNNLKREGHEYIELIDVYRRKQGRYPSSLQEADIFTRKTRYGEWKYRPDEQDQQFTLSIGDYDSWSPFTLTWHSESGSWYLDT